MKFWNFRLFFYFWTIALCQNQEVTWKCEYKNGSYGFNIGLPLRYGYTCHLSSSHNHAVEVTEIQGYHQSGKSDDDVEHLVIHGHLKKFSPIFCQKFKNLKVIGMLDKKIVNFDEVAFGNCKNLEIIDLSSNNPHESFDILHPTKAEIVDKPTDYPLLRKFVESSQYSVISHRSVPEFFFETANRKLSEHFILQNILNNYLPPLIFHPLLNLQYLKFYDNKISYFKPEWFVNLKNLKYLNFERNVITELENGIFSPLENLQELTVSGNKISALRPDSFEGLQNLKRLVLSENQIFELPTDVFVPLINLEELQLNTNRLTTIHSDSFGFHNNLTKIQLHHNKIRSFDENIIENSNLSEVTMKINVCSNETIRTRSEIKEKLRICIRNYQPRPTIPDACGISVTAKGNIVGGTKITRGSYPWIAALERTSGEFFCGGTILTNKKVVTAAHCIQSKNEKTPLLKRDFIVLLGAHDLNMQREVGRIASAVESIHMHPDWSPLTENYDADIAVLILEEKITFSRFIQPICLIDSNSYLSLIKKGSVVGFGKSEDPTKIHENIAKVIDTPIHKNEDCFLMNFILAKFSSKRTVCGGTGNGTGVCEGDSGSGLFVYYGGVYYLRGIVSASLFNRTSHCDVDTYSIFTNMKHFNDWVNEIGLDDGAYKVQPIKKESFFTRTWKTIKSIF